MLSLCCSVWYSNTAVNILMLQCSVLVVPAAAAAAAVLVLVPHSTCCKTQQGSEPSTLAARVNLSLCGSPLRGGRSLLSHLPPTSSANQKADQLGEGWQWARSTRCCCSTRLLGQASFLRSNRLLCSPTPRTSLLLSRTVFPPVRPTRQAA